MFIKNNFSTVNSGRYIVCHKGDVIGGYNDHVFRFRPYEILNGKINFDESTKMSIMEEQINNKGRCCECHDPLREITNAKRNGTKVGSMFFSSFLSLYLLLVDVTL